MCLSYSDGVIQGSDPDDVALISSVSGAVGSSEATVCPPDPAAHVQPKPGGGIGLPRLLLVKPDRTGDGILDGILVHG